MSKCTIICVDDEIIILMSLIRELKNSFDDKFLYERTTNAKEALEMIEELASEGMKAPIIISDWLMPGIRGDEFLKQAIKKSPDIKAIMITGMADEDAIAKTLENKSVVSVLKKPWNPRELKNLIISCCPDAV